jgi:DNA-binding transcriptional regulator YiaG
VYGVSVTFAKSLKKWRKRNGLKQTGAAYTLQVPYRTYQDWEMGIVPHSDRQKIVEERMSQNETGSKTSSPR